MDEVRKPLQGVCNIIRFNWHFFVLAAATILFALILRVYVGPSARVALDVLIVLVVGLTLLSLLVSSYVYDFSGLYRLSWLDAARLNHAGKHVNIHAGYDETSALLKRKFPKAELTVLDFYDPQVHREISLTRARRASPPFPNTQQVKTDQIPLADNSVEAIFAILSAHEIRHNDERIAFFSELRRAVTETGRIVVVEHLRDAANFLAYNFGAFHFHSYATWLATFRAAGLHIDGEIKITPFITAFILSKNGTKS